MTITRADAAKALVVLSGGQDSTTCLALAVAEHGAENVQAITFDYGQRHSRELAAAVQVAALFGIAPPEILVLHGGVLKGTSPLTDRTQQLEQYSSYEEMDAIIGDRVEKTFVPMRNALFLTIAANRAAVLGAGLIYTGVCQADNANYPDCRKVFVSAQQHAINQALGYDDSDPGVDDHILRIMTPLMFLTKAQSIHYLLERCGPTAYARLAWTHTAYDGQYPPIGADHATVLRAQGFVEAGMPDPLIVRAHMEGRMELPDTPNYKDPTTLSSLRTLIRAERDRMVGQAQPGSSLWSWAEDAVERPSTLIERLEGGQ